MLNNSELGKISKEQRSAHLDVWQTSLHNPSFAEFATLIGALGIRVSRLDELDAAMTQGLAHDGPALIEVISDAALV